MRNLVVSSYGKASLTCCTIQLLVGWRVTLKCRTRPRSWPRIKRTQSKPGSVPSLCDSNHEAREVLHVVCNRFRIDPGIGSPAVDYRIENGLVERRSVKTTRQREATSEKWQRLTSSQEHTSRVMADTIVLRWLGRRIELRWLIRACNQQSSVANDGTLDRSDQIGKRPGDTKHPGECRRRLVGRVRVVSSSFIVSVRSTFPGYRVVS
jgi:hypothetical protein